MIDKPAKALSFSESIMTETYQKSIANALRDPQKVQQFTASLISAVSENQNLLECEHASILKCALLGNSLSLPPSPQLGYYYFVPYWNSEKKCCVADFRIGYKGLMQLALRSGQYEYLNVITLKDGELKKWDRLKEEAILSYIEDETEYEKAKTAGYLAYFKLLNGFKKTIYWSRGKMEAHADRYSKAFSLQGSIVKTKKGEFKKVSFHDYLAKNFPAKDEWLYSSYWYKDFDSMAHKTMLRQLLTKWGIMSIEMQIAIEADNELENDVIDIYPNLENNLEPTTDSKKLAPKTIKINDIPSIEE